MQQLVTNTFALLVAVGLASSCLAAALDASEGAKSGDVPTERDRDFAIDDVAAAGRQ